MEMRSDEFTRAASLIARNVVPKFKPYSIVEYEIKVENQKMVLRTLWSQVGREVWRKIYNWVEPNNRISWTAGYSFIRKNPVVELLNIRYGELMPLNGKYWDFNKKEQLQEFEGKKINFEIRNLYQFYETILKEIYEPGDKLLVTFDRVVSPKKMNRKQIRINGESLLYLPVDSKLQEEFDFSSDGFKELLSDESDWMLANIWHTRKGLMFI